MPVSGSGHASDADRNGSATDALSVRNTLSRTQRLAESRLFRDAFDNGRRFVGGLLVMWLRTGPDAARRVGVIASKRTFRRAVDRGRAKRLLREAFRLNRARLEGQWDMVLVARARILPVRRQDVDRELLQLAAKAGLIPKQIP